MNITYLKNQTGNHLFNVDGTEIYLWNSGRSLISLNDFSQRYDFERKMFEEGNIDQMTNFLVNNEFFVKQFIGTASAAKQLNDSYRNIPVKKFASIVGNEIMITTVDLTRGRVSIHASMSSVEKQSDIIKYAKSGYVDLFINEEELKPREANQKFWEIVRVEGVAGISDISNFYHSFSYRKSEYYFTFSGSGGYDAEILNMHPELKALFALKNDTDMIKAIYQYSLLPNTDNFINEVLTLGRKLISTKK